MSTRKASQAALFFQLFIGMSTIAFPQIEAKTEEEPERRQDILVQRRLAKRSQLSPYTVSRAEERILAYEKRPLFAKLTQKGYSGVRLRLGGMPSGSGFVFGGGYVAGLKRRDFLFTLDGLYSTKQYTQLSSQFEFVPPSLEGRIRLFVAGDYHDYTSIGFFGLGGSSRKDDRSFFEDESRSFGFGVGYQPHRRVSLAAAARLLNTNVGGGDRSPSFDENFDPTLLPGADGSDYFAYSGTARLLFLDEDEPGAGIILGAETERFSDRADLGQNFTRLTGEVQLHVPLGVRSRRIAFRARTSHSVADAGQIVPFHAMETLGGAKSLRGFQEYRFRDARNLLFNLEYRWEIWPYADLALFSDAGKVFSRAGDLDLSDLEASYGVGLRFHLPGIGSAFRFDLARSQEGIVFHVSGGPDF